MHGGIGALAFSALTASGPLVLAALGGLATEASGSISIALEGYMLIGAFSAAACGQATGCLGLGLAAGVAAGILLSLIVASTHRYLRADVFVAGLAANILAPGLASVISQAAYRTKGVLVAEPIRSTPIGILGLLAISSVALALLLSKSAFGLRLRAVGEGDEIAKAAGIDSRRYRFVAHIISGASSGLVGATLAAGVGAYVPGMSTGRGWIALVAVFLGARKTGGVIGAGLLFGLLFAIANSAQSLFGRGQASSILAEATELLQALPFIATAVALALWKRIERSRKGAS
jgi:general nucleoside transport system permease protein